MSHRHPSHWLKTLGAHLVPSSIEANIIREDISHAEEDLRLVEREISVQETVLNKLSCRRDEISTSIENHKALLSPVRRLPDEILAQIFMHCFQHPDYIAITDSRRVPLSLAKISSHWRAIALSTQALWSFIYVYLKESTVQGCLASVTFWLEKSGTHPLSVVFIDHTDLRNEDSLPWASSVLGAILPSSHRWQHLQICGAPRITYEILPIRNGLPLLESLRIQLYATPAEPIFDSFEIAPKLRSVTLLHSFYPHQIKLPWSHLTEFSASTPGRSPAECLEVLRECSNLISCTFTTLRDKIEPLKTPLRHSHLRTLSIPLESGLGGFFDCLTLPALDAVQFGPNRSKLPNDTPVQLIAFLSRSACTVRKLVWDVRPNIPLDILLQCLETMKPCQ